MPADPGLPLPCEESFDDGFASTVGIAHGFEESCAGGFCPAAKVHGFAESVIGMVSRMTASADGYWPGGGGAGGCGADCGPEL